MKRFLKLIVFIGWLMVSLEGCKSLRPSTHQTTTTIVEDTSTVQVTERFVPVYLPGDTVIFYQAVECPEEIPVKPFSSVTTRMDSAWPTRPKPKPFKVQVTGKRSSGSIEIDDLGRLKAIFNCNAWIDSVKVRDLEISRLKSVSKSDSTIIQIPVKFIPKVYKWAMGFSLSVIGLIVLFIIIQLVRLYIKLKPF